MPDTKPKISRRAALDAATAGGEAFRAGKDLSDNPHLGGGDLYYRIMAHYWRKGYGAASTE